MRRSAAAKVTVGQQCVLDATSEGDKREIEQLHVEMWRERVERMTGIASYDEMRRLLYEQYFPPS